MLDADMRGFEQSRNLGAMRARMVQASPDELATAAGWLWRSWLALIDDELAQAKDLAGRGLSEHPDSVDLMLHQSVLDLAEAGNSGAMAMMSLARRLRQNFERAVELEPDHVAARQALIQFYLNAPRIAGGGVRRAQPHLRYLEQLSPEAYFELRAQMSLMDGDINDALGWLDQAAAQRSSPSVLFSRAMILQSADRHTDAKEVLQALVDEWPEHAGGWYQLGRVSALAEAWLDEGLEAFDRFLDLPVWPGDPSPAAAWWRKGQLHMMNQSADLARQAFERSLELDPEFSNARVSLEALMSSAEG